MTKTRQPYRESPAIGAFMRRMTKALIRRAGEGDIEALSVLLDLQRETQAAIVEAGRALHATGYSYGDLARHTGVSKQAAIKRYGVGEQAAGAEPVVVAAHAAAAVSSG